MDFLITWLMSFLVDFHICRCLKSVVSRCCMTQCNSSSRSTPRSERHHVFDAKYINNYCHCHEAQSQQWPRFACCRLKSSVDVTAKCRLSSNSLFYCVWIATCHQANIVNMNSECSVNGVLKISLHWFLRCFRDPCWAYIYTLYYVSST